MKIVVILFFCVSFGFCEILSLSPKEKRAMRNDFAVLDNAYRKGYSDNIIEFAEKFLEQYKLASVSQEPKIRNMYQSVNNLIEFIKSNNSADENKNITHIDTVIEDGEMKKMFNAVLLGTAEDIIFFSNKYPNFREKDIYGALERARVNDLSAILHSISKNSIPANEIIRFSEIYGDTISVQRIKTAAERLVLRNTVLLRDFRAVFGITEFEERVEQFLYNRIMYENEYKNLIVYIEHFPEGKYIKFVSDLVNNYR
jgi:hypothetical protein